MAASHKFAESDGEGRNKTPDWASSTTTHCDSKEQAAQSAMVARQAKDETKQMVRSYNQKRSHRPDS